MQTSARLICPKCEGEMRSYESNGILVDECRCAAASFWAAASSSDCRTRSGRRDAASNGD